MPFPVRRPVEGSTSANPLVRDCGKSIKSTSTTGLSDSDDAPSKVKRYRADRLVVVISAWTPFASEMLKYPGRALAESLFHTTALSLSCHLHWLISSFGQEGWANIGKFPRDGDCKVSDIYRFLKFQDVTHATSAGVMHMGEPGDNRCIICEACLVLTYCIGDSLCHSCYPLEQNRLRVARYSPNGKVAPGKTWPGRDTH